MVPLFDVYKCPGKLEGAQTAATLWDPSGKRIVLQLLRFTVSAAGVVKIFKNTDASGNYLVNQYFAAGSGLSEVYQFAPSLAAGDILKVTTEAGDFYPTLAGQEV